MAFSGIGFGGGANTSPLAATAKSKFHLNDQLSGTPRCITVGFPSMDPETVTPKMLYTDASGNVKPLEKAAPGTCPYATAHADMITCDFNRQPCIEWATKQDKYKALRATDPVQCKLVDKIKALINSVPCLVVVHGMGNSPDCHGSHVNHWHIVTHAPQDNVRYLAAWDPLRRQVAEYKKGEPNVRLHQMKLRDLAKYMKYLQQGGGRVFVGCNNKQLFSMWQSVHGDPTPEGPIDAVVEVMEDEPVSASQSIFGDSFASNVGVAAGMTLAASDILGMSVVESPATPPLKIPKTGQNDYEVHLTGNQPTKSMKDQDIIEAVAKDYDCADLPQLIKAGTVRREDQFRVRYIRSNPNLLKRYNEYVALEKEDCQQVSLGDLCNKYMSTHKDDVWGTDDMMSLDETESAFGSWVEEQGWDWFQFVCALFLTAAKLHPKKAAMVILGESNCGKSVWLKKTLMPLFSHAVSFSIVGISDFLFQECVGAQASFIEELRIAPALVDVVKGVMGGDGDIMVSRKCLPKAKVGRQPFFITSNNVPWRDCMSEKAALENRMQIFKTKKSYKDLVLEKIPNPVYFACLFAYMGTLGAPEVTVEQVIECAEEATWEGVDFKTGLYDMYMEAVPDANPLSL